MIKGFGTVVTGTLLSGEFHVGESLALEPGGRSVRVRGMQNHGHAEPHVRAGSRVALNLAGIEVSDANRGQTLVPEGTLIAVTTIDVDAVLLTDSTPVKHRSRIHFHAFTADTLATVSLYGYEAAEPGTSRLMRLKLQKPIVLVPGDRFVLRSCSPAATIGGGHVLDAHPLPNLRKAKCFSWLGALKDSPPEEQLLLRVARRGTVGLTMQELVAETGLTREALQRITELLINSKRLLRIRGNVLLTNEAAAIAIDSITSRLEMDTINDDLKRSELKNQTGLRTEVFDFLLEKLATEKKLHLRQERIYPAAKEWPLADADSKLRSIIASIYEGAGLAAPSSAEVAARLNLKENEMRRHMTHLLRERVLIKMGLDEIYIHNRPLETLREQLRSLRGQALDVAGFKQLTGLSRKYAIPLLEYLERERITRKVGDKRLVL